ncbi:MAG: hypothetical protein AB1403_06120 [Candidatus Riflebacteria bacterium]
MKKLTGIFLLTALLAFCLNGAVSARNLAMKDGKVAFFVPETWKNDFQGNIVSTESPDGGVAVVFTLLQNELLDQALAEAEASIVEAVGPIVENGEILEFTVNGMPATMQKGTAQKGQTSVSITMVLTPAGRWLMIMYMGNLAQEAFWKKDLGEILSSVKPVE